MYVLSTIMACRKASQYRKRPKSFIEKDVRDK
jgi:hypothetical protein